MIQRQVLGLTGRGHLLGRQAAVVAKQVLLDRKAVVLHHEGINTADSFHRRTGNSARQAAGKTKRGPAAPGRLKVFDGIPPLYGKKKPMVGPAALKVVRLKPIPKFAYT
ncbi:hypothetical protein K5549_001869 [Capra hircus]|nr:hypothetical protein K5549_001869 [Capra hircus]